MDCLVGDAFQADEQKSNKQHGISVQTDKVDIVFGDSPESKSIDPKCNTVCLIKYDKRVYRNTIAVSESFICYMVKGNLLRVIDSASGKMTLLRGHESIVQDIRFSPADKDVLCSVDAGEGSGRHVFVWRLANDSDIDQSLLFSLPLKANNVKSHPLTPSCWGISFGNEVGLFHIEVDAGAQSYQDLKCHLSFKDQVIDFCFSPNGKHVAVINGTDTQTTIGVFNLAGGGSAEQMRAGQCSLAPQYFVVAEPGHVFSGLSLLAPLTGEADTDCVLVTLSVCSGQDTSASSSSTLQVWRLSGGKQTMTQSISLSIPQSPQTEPSAFPLSTLTIDTLEEKFLLVSSRRSTIVACLGISSPDDSSCQRLYHCTFLNLKNPVASLVSSTMRIREKDETGRVPEPHVEITCFQDQQTGQNAVQQYHVPSRWVFQPPCPAQQQQQEQQQQQQQVAAPVVLSPISFGAEKIDSSTFLKSVLFSNPPAAVSATATQEQKVATPPPPVAALITPVAAAVQPVSTPVSGSAGISILSQHNGLTSSLPVGSFPDFALISDNNSSTVAQKTPDSSSTSSALLPPKQAQEDIGVKSKQILLSALKVHPSPPPPVVASIAPSLDRARDASLATSTQKPPVAVAVAKPKPVASSIVVPIVAVESKKQKQQQLQQQKQQSLEEDEDDWERASISISRSQPSTPLGSSDRKSALSPSFPSSDQAASFALKFDELLALSLRMEEKIASLEEKTLATEKQRKKATAADASALPKALAGMKTELAREVVSGVEQAQLRVLSGLSEQQAQQAVANILASDKWRQQLSTQVAADLRKELSPAISQTIRSSVKDHLRGAVTDSFRAMLEATIVPAYEAGSREMFSQLQQTHSAGVEAMKADNKLQCERSNAETVALRNEISSLRSVVSSLEDKISMLSQGGHVVGSTGDAPSVRYETDFKQLMREGRIGESLEVALEAKDIDSVLWVLKEQALAPEGLTALFEKATEVSILCTAQQLSADLAMNEPEEGIRSRLECLKEMVMFLIDDHMPGGDVAEVVACTLSNLRRAEAKHTLVGAARTDMKMLCSILSSNF